MKWILAATLLVAACGQGIDPSPYGDTQAPLVTPTGTTTIADALANVGAGCFTSDQCVPGLTCTNTLVDSVHGQLPICAIAWTSNAPCPRGFTYTVTATVGLGEVNLGGLPVTGYWCQPQCDVAADCSNAQCCVGGHGFGGASPSSRGTCETFDPWDVYLAPYDCP